MEKEIIDIESVENKSFNWILLAIVLGLAFIPLISGLSDYIQTNNAKLLIGNSIGFFFAQDYHLEKSFDLIKKENSVYANNGLKILTLIHLFLLGFVIYLFYKLWVKIFSVFNVEIFSKHDGFTTFLKNFLEIILAVLVVALLSFIFVGLNYGIWDIPFKGIFNFIIHIGDLLKVVGI